MRTRVKFCGITTVEQAQAAVAAGCDALGLVFVPDSSRVVTIEQAQAIVQTLPAFVTTVAVVANQAETRIDEILDRVRIDYLQFHGDESTEFCQQFGQSYIKALRVGKDPISIAEQDYTDAAAILLDSYQPDKLGGTGQCFDWQNLPQLDRAWILAGGLHPGNVIDAIRTLHPHAVDVSGGIETAPGEKDPQRMQQFIENVRIADAKNTINR